MYIPSYIDQGHNPELFTRHQLEQTVADHQAVQRKVQAYKVASLVAIVMVIVTLDSMVVLQEFRTQLIQQLEAIFPVEIEAYVASSQQK